jgi:hypothetical protein
MSQQVGNFLQHGQWQPNLWTFSFDGWDLSLKLADAWSRVRLGEADELQGEANLPVLLELVAERRE